MELSREKLETAFARVIANNRELDPLTLAERLADRLEYLVEDSDGGSGMPPISLKRQEVPPLREQPDNAPEPIRRSPAVKPPPMQSSSIIVAPDSAEYQKALEQADPRLRGSEKPKKPAKGGRLSNLGRPAAKSSTVAYWTVESLIQELTTHTPSELPFTPDGIDAEVVAIRNIQPIIMTQGPSVVRLEYALPGASRGESSTDTGGSLDKVVLPLVATHTFDLTTADLNLEEVLDGLVEQLSGMYAKMFNPARRSFEPADTGESVMDSFNVNDPSRSGPMGTQDGVSRDQVRRERNPNRDFVGQVKATNRQFGNKNKR